jgi:biopolymer transport protein ExbB/TolQ
VAFAAQEMNPYASPSTAVREGNSDSRRLRSIRSAAGWTILLALLCGIMFTVIGMIRSFNTLATADNVRPVQLANDIAMSLLIGSIAIPIAVVAFIVRIWASIRLRHVRRIEGNT